MLAGITLELAFVGLITLLQIQSANIRNGWALFEKGSLAEAHREFELAVQQSPENPQPRLGLALVKAAQGNIKEAERLLRGALPLAKTNQAKLDHHATAIRYYTLTRSPEDWLDLSKKHFYDGLRLNTTYPALQYRMARAYVGANDLGRAQDLFAQVVSMGRDFASDADREWKRIHKVLRASPATRTGTGIAMQDRVSRADLCALIAAELSLSKLFDKTTQSASVPEPPDIAHHRLRQDVLTILHWKIRGLEVRPDGRFAPDEPVQRGEFAFVLEDVLIKTTGDKALATRYLGTETSPFADVAPTHPWFNSIMNVASRALIESDSDGRFYPDENIDGADTLLAIRKLSSQQR